MKGKGKLPQPRQDQEPYQSSVSSASDSDSGMESPCCPEDQQGPQQIQLLQLWRAYEAAFAALGMGPITEAI